MLCAIGLSSFSRHENHVAEIEAWTMYAAYVLAIAERWRLPRSIYEDSLRVAKDFIYESLMDLCHEVMKRNSLIHGDALYDNPFGIYRVRVTWILSLLSVLAFWRHARGFECKNVDEFIHELVWGRKDQVHLWGEAAVPQLLAIYWYLEKTNAHVSTERFLLDLHDLVVNRNKRHSKLALAGPYYGVQDVLPHQWGLPDKQIKDSFDGVSYALEALTHLVVRRNWKQPIRLAWPDITTIALAHFQPQRKWQFYRWRNEGEGVNHTVLPRHRQDWSALKETASDVRGSQIPKLMREDAEFLLLFTIVYPHRFMSSVARWLDHKLGLNSQWC